MLDKIVYEIFKFKFSELFARLEFDKSIFGKFISDPQPIVVKLDFNSAIVVVDYFQFTSRLKSLDIRYRVICCDGADFRFRGCSATTSRLSLLNYQFIGFHFASSIFNLSNSIILCHREEIKQWRIAAARHSNDTGSSLYPVHGSLVHSKYFFVFRFIRLGFVVGRCFFVGAHISVVRDNENSIFAKLVQIFGFQNTLFSE